MPRSLQVSVPSRPRWKEKTGVMIIALGVVLFYLYLARTLAPYEFTKNSKDYYPLLVDGFRSGRLSLKVDPPPQLAALKPADLYDPAKRAQTGVHSLLDVTYYQGRYYLYFGVAPALTLFWPFRAITGVHFPQNLAVAVFCAGGYLCSIGLLLGLRRAYFPACRAGTVWLGTLMLGLANFCPVMLVRSFFWEVPIASAYFYSCLGLWLLFIGLHRVRQRLRWLFLASSACGLAVASRPHFVFGAAALGAMWLWLRRDCLVQRRRPDRIWLQEAAVLFLPCGTVIGGLFIYNYLRFGSPLEFGMKYMLGSLDSFTGQMMSPRYFLINFYYNFLAPTHVSRYFPFFQGMSFYPGAEPRGYFGFEYPAGVLTSMPVSWLAVLAPLIWTRWHRVDRRLGAWLLVFGLYFAALLPLVLCFNSATNRYMVDFLPTLLLVAMLGLLMLDCRSETWSRVMRIGTKTCLAGLVLYTAFFNVMEAFRFFDYLKTKRPETYEWLSREFNRPSGWWEAANHQPYGLIELTLRLAPDRIGTTEPLLVTGAPEASDYVYVRYLDGTHIQVGSSHGRGASIVSQPIVVDYAVTHTIAVQMGSLYPPATHRYFDGRSQAEVKAAKHTVHVAVDRVPYLDGEQDFYDASPRSVFIGHNPISEYGGRKFHGEILAVERRPMPPVMAPFTGGEFVRLAFKLPAAGAIGRREPLVATGNSPQGDMVFLTGDDATHVRLGFYHAGVPIELSDPILIQPEAIQLMEASLGSFYRSPANARERELARSLVLRFNGRIIWSGERTFHPAAESPPIIGANPWGNDASAGQFSGQIMAQQGVQLLPSAPDQPFVFTEYWQEEAFPSHYGGLRLQVELPRDRAGRPEPLLVTGPSASQADYIWIYYADAAKHAILGYEHTGGGGPKTLSLPVDFTKPHVIEIKVPSLYPPEGDAYFSDRTMAEIIAMKSRGVIALDGKPCIDAPVLSWLSTPGQATIGESRLAPVFGQRFSGKIMAVEHSGFSLPPGLIENAGPLQFVLRFPEAGSGSELVMATGQGQNMDSLLVVYEGPARLKFVLRSAQGISLASAPVNIDPGARQTLQIAWGGLYLGALRPPAIAAEAWRQRQHAIKVSLNGTVLIDGQADFFPAVPLTVSLGGSATTGERAFSGHLISVRRLPAASP